MAAVNLFFFWELKEKKSIKKNKKQKTFKEIKTQIPNVLRAWSFQRRSWGCGWRRSREFGRWACGWRKSRRRLWRQVWPVKLRCLGIFCWRFMISKSYSCWVNLGITKLKLLLLLLQIHEKRETKSNFWVQFPLQHINKRINEWNRFLMFMISCDFRPIFTLSPWATFLLAWCCRRGSREPRPPCNRTTPFGGGTAPAAAQGTPKPASASTSHSVLAAVFQNTREQRAAPIFLVFLRLLWHLCFCFCS